MENSKKEITLGFIYDKGWRLAKKHWGKILLLDIVAFMASQLIYSSSSVTYLRMFPQLLRGTLDPAAMDEMILDSYFSVNTVIAVICAIAITVFISVIRYRYLKMAAMGEENIDMTGLIKSSIRLCLTYIVKSVVASVLTIIGLLFCILPGLYIALRLMFVPMVAANEPELGIEKTISLSWSMTRGRVLQLLGYGIAACLINVVGFLCCCVGVYYSQIVTKLMFASLYVELCDETNVTDSASDDEAETYVKDI